ncbi:MAG: restriction endonuclease subunit S [Kiritimatiellaeota bacterium]|nr:restriction endonuclease subunit S [Kiritimatiellota bacterium]
MSEVAFYSELRINTSQVNADNYVGVDNLLPDKHGKVASCCVPTKGNLIEYRINDVLIGNIRPYLKKIWFATHDGGTNGDVLTIRIKEQSSADLLPKYFYYLLASDDFFDYDTQYSKGAKMPRGDKTAVMKYSIPIPPLAEQERIVAILDKFSALANDLTQGLPAEIEARRKQYEFYRDKLLTFKESAS